MKIKSVLFGILLGILFSIGVFFLIGNDKVQKISNINLNNGLKEKISSIKEKIFNLSSYNKKIDFYETDSSLYDKDKLRKINKIKNILDKEYYDPAMISGTKMWDVAMQAYVAGLGDPFTNYLTAKDNTSLMDELKGSSDFQGIGAYVTKVPEGVMIEQIIKNSPAQKAGLKPTDIVLQANGTGLADLPLGKAVSLIKGPAGTEVELTIKRDGKILKIKVKRAKVKITSVNSNIITYKGKKIGYISISAIGEQTYSQLKEQVNDLLKQKIDGIILDLRGNGGGYLDKGYQIASMWAKKQDVIVQTKYRNSFNNKIYKAEKTGILHNIPTVILVDAYTASAGEIITAGIRENNEKTVKIVGTKTFGKGTIQTLKEFKDHSSLKYTIGKWFTPKGENVCKKGVLPGNGLKPDVEVNFDKETYKKNGVDNQKEKAKEILLEMLKKGK